MFHLTHGEGAAPRKCRRSLRDGLARQLGLDRAWLSGETEALKYVVTADAAVVNLDPSVSGHVVPRWSVWPGSPPPIAEIQLALDRLMADAHAALRRDLAQLPGDYAGSSSREQMIRFALLVVVHSVEMGNDRGSTATTTRSVIVT